MTSSSNFGKLLDHIGWKILAILQEDARIQYAELGRRVGLSTPAVIERVRRMEEARIITGYHAEIDHRKVGIPVCAYIRLRVVGDLSPRVIAVAKQMPEVHECHRITGEDSFSAQSLCTYLRGVGEDGRQVHALRCHRNDARILFCGHSKNDRATQGD